MEALVDNLHQYNIVNITHKLNKRSGSFVALVFLTLSIGQYAYQY